MFVVYFGWGVAGAAIASVTAFACPWPYLIWRIRRTEVMRLHRQDWKFHWPTVSRLLRLGLPLAVQNSVISIGTIILQAAVNGYGALHVAGFTGGTKIFFFFKEPAVAINYAMATFTAQNYGAGNLARVQQGLRRGVIISLCVSALAMMILFLFSYDLIALLVSGDETTVISIGGEFLRMLTFMLPVLYLLMTYRPVLLGLGNTTIPMLSGILELLARIGLVLLLPGLIGFCGIAIAEVSAWLAAAILVIASYYVGIRRLVRRNLPRPGVTLVQKPVAKAVLPGTG